ncbi:hypothetical protein [Streptomyces violens]|uniref:hypothetical protein n=1 Tax=Streptomyces violens TaxID=66377 RepID=UPI0004BF8E83|nr:hypothetical protein [Streptomyces violens]
MHGPAAPAPPPPRPAKPGTVVLLRVVFVAIAVLSIGMLAWVTLLRAALVHRRPVGWWIFGVDAALAIPLLAVVGSVPENDWRGDVAMALILLQMAGAVAYYLVVDIRARARSLAGYPADHGRTIQPYGAPAYGVPAYGAPGPYASTPNPYAALGPAPTPTPVPAHPQPSQAQPRPQRIDQVRAELDELSDYLRRGGNAGESAGDESRRKEEGR